MLRRVMGVTMMMLVTAGSVAAGPFGIDMGASLDSFRVHQQGEGTAVIDAPDAHEDFTSYMVVHHKKFGVCAVQARTNDIKSNDFGDQIKASFYELRDDLRELYGEPEDFDFMVPDKTKKTVLERIDGYPKEPNEWFRAVLTKKRIFASMWGQNEQSRMKNNISTIKIEPVANPFSGKNHEASGYLIIQYQFKNFEECQKSIEAENFKGKGQDKL